MLLAYRQRCPDRVFLVVVHPAERLRDARDEVVGADVES